MSSQQTNALSHSSAPCGLTNSFHGITTAGLALIVVLCLIAPSAVRAQAPGLVWSTNVGARIFAVDGADNLYATAGNTVIVINGAGVPQSTNTICPIGGVAQRDGAGNFYFAGSFDGTQNFGGITLVGGWTNAPTPSHWAAGWPTCYFAKYDSAGNLVNVTSFGQQSYRNHLSGLLLDGNGGCFAAYSDSANEAMVAHLNSSFGVVWTIMIDSVSAIEYEPVSLGGLTSSNCCLLAYRSGGGNIVPAGRIDLAGNLGRIGQYPVRWTTPECSNGIPVIDDLANFFEVGQCFDPTDPGCTNQILRKCGPGTSEIWRETISPDTQWTLARDVQSHLYVAGTNGMLAQYDTDGVLIWSNNFGHSAIGMAVGSSGHRFVSFDDGSIAELQTDPAPQAPLVVNPPQPATVFVGSNVTLSVTATGGAPLHYQWLQNGSAVADGTTSALNFPSAVPSQSGSYTVVVTNMVGSVTSAPALLRVKMVELYFGSQLLTNGTYTFTSPPSLSIRSAFASGSSFYTLDGSPPTFASTYYTGAFTVTQSATVQAIGYSSDFSQSELADAINAVVLVQHTLTTSTPGGGSVSLNPPGGTYLSTNVVTATAVPDSGYLFLYWEGDASGSNPSVNVSMERNKILQAVFGTSLSTTVAGSGQVVLYPPAGPYSYGSVVRLTAVPQAGNYFGAWGNAASGNANPLYFTINSPAPTVSSIFGSTPAGQAALTVEVTGSGRVTVNPRANAYTLGQAVTLTAVPDVGQSFTNWSGDATGTTNPLNVSMNQAKVITANFTARPTLSATRPGLEGFTADGFRFTLLSAPQTAWQILGSSNLSSWQTLGTVSNAFGEVQFTDPNALNHSPGFYKATPAP